jgi:hypothetical protein
VSSHRFLDIVSDLVDAAHQWRRDRFTGEYKVCAMPRSA